MGKKYDVKLCAIMLDGIMKDPETTLLVHHVKNNKVHLSDRERQLLSNLSGLENLSNLENLRLSRFSYEFIDKDDDKDGVSFMMNEQTYIIRDAKLVGQLPLGSTQPKDVCFTLIVDEAAAAKAGSITPSQGDTINGEEVFNITDAMHVRIIYDAKNKDWVVIGTLG